MDDLYTLELHSQNSSGSVEESNRMILGLLSQLMGMRDNYMILKSIDMKLEFEPHYYDGEALVFKVNTPI